MFGFIRKLINQAYIRYDSISYARLPGVKIGGRCKLVAPTGGTFGAEPYLIELGDHVEVLF